MKHIYTSLDIGSNGIKIVVCELFQNKLNVLAATSFKSKGIKRGLISDFELASITVKQAFQEIEDMLGIKINKVITSVPSYMSEYKIIKGSVGISNQMITNEDVIKSLDVAIEKWDSKDREMVTVLPIDFKVDDNISIKDPTGLKGHKLSSRSLLVSVPKKNVYSVLGLLEKVKIEVADISLNNIGDYYAFKNRFTNSELSAIINMGSSTTSISLYNHDVVVKSTILHVGGNNLDEIIMEKYGVDKKTALMLKHKFAVASKRKASNETMECTNIDGKKRKIKQYEISEMMETELKDIFYSIKNGLNSLTSKKIDYIIITGGMSNMVALEDVASDVLGKVNIGNIKMIGIRNNKYSSCMGNIIYFISKLKLKGQNYTMIDDGDAYNLARIGNRSNTPDSMLGKIFGYFFND